MLRMDLRPKPKIRYPFIKHPLKPIDHNETVSKARLVLLHYIITFNTMNVAKIIVQEIQAFSKKKDGMRKIYFLALFLKQKSLSTLV